MRPGRPGQGPGHFPYDLLGGRVEEGADETPPPPPRPAGGRLAPLAGVSRPPSLDHLLLPADGEGVGDVSRAAGAERGGQPELAGLPGAAEPSTSGGEPGEAASADVTPRASQPPDSSAGARTPPKAHWDKVKIAVKQGKVLADIERPGGQPGTPPKKKMSFGDVALLVMMQKKQQELDSILAKEGLQEGSVQEAMGRSIAKSIINAYKDRVQSPTKKGPSSPDGGSGDEEEDGSDVELSEDHTRLLYLIYCFTERTDTDEETWIRKVPLMVLIYEGIVEGVFEYDYAPAADIVNGKRTYLNLSQEGRDDIDDLREAGLIYCLKLSSKKYQSTIAYRLTPFGKQHLQDSCSEEDRELVEKVLYPGESRERKDIFMVVWDDEESEFRLETASGVTKPSTITEIESVSYVSSPYIPRSMMRTTRKCSSNKSQTEQLANAVSNIKDELDEELTLDSVNIVIGEWIPMGANQIVALNDKLGSTERVQGGFFTAVVDENPDASEFVGESEGLSQVEILDFNETEYVNFEAEVHFPEEDGIIQVENFGVHIDEGGFLAYGMKCEGIMQAVENEISLDNMSRLLVDVHGDSSKLVDNLLSPHQRIMLEMTFLNDAEHRDKFNVIFCTNINPMLKAAEYFDKEAKENELKQVIGDTYIAEDLGEKEVLIVGKNGIILCSPDVDVHEEYVMYYLSLMSRNMFMRSLFQRTFILTDVLKHIRHLIDTNETDPNSVTTIRRLLSESSAEITLLSEIQSYLSESLAALEAPQRPDPESQPQVAKLYKVLGLSSTASRLQRRILDMKKNIDGSKGDVDSLREMANAVAEGRGFRVQEAVQANTKNLEDVFRANERQSASLEIMQVVLAGSLAFDVLDRLHGLYLGIAADIVWANEVFGWVYQTPMMLFLMNLAAWAGIGGFIMWSMKHVAEKAAGVLSINYLVNTPINFDKLLTYLQDKEVEVEDSHADKLTFLKKYSWDETDKVRWQGEPPRIEVLVDTRYHFLLKAFIQVSTNMSKVRQDDVRELFFGELRDRGVIVGEHLQGIEVIPESEASPGKVLEGDSVSEKQGEYPSDARRDSVGSFAKDGRRESGAGREHHSFVDGRDALGTHLTREDNTITTKKGFSEQARRMSDN